MKIYPLFYIFGSSLLLSGLSATNTFGSFSTHYFNQKTGFENSMSDTTNIAYFNAPQRMGMTEYLPAVRPRVSSKRKLAEVFTGSLSNGLYVDYHDQSSMMFQLQLLMMNQVNQESTQSQKKYRVAPFELQAKRVPRREEGEENYDQVIENETTSRIQTPIILPMTENNQKRRVSFNQVVAYQQFSRNSETSQIKSINAFHNPSETPHSVSSSFQSLHLKN